jgi:hypothetical protein
VIALRIVESSRICFLSIHPAIRVVVHWKLIWWGEAAGVLEDAAEGVVAEKGDS